MTEMQVAGRGGVPIGSTAVVLNVTVTESEQAGFVTVYPCGSIPSTSSVNFIAGQTVANAVIVKTSPTGTVCVYASAATHLVVDGSGAFAMSAAFQPLVPSRLLDTRADGLTIDGRFAGIGVRAGGSITEILVDGRGNVPEGSAAVVLNVTVTEPARAGFVTVFPCGSIPLTSSVNFVAGQTVANTVIAKTSPMASVCVFASTPTHLVIDVHGAYAPGWTFEALVPARLMDTRPDGVTTDGQLAGLGVRAGGSVTELQVSGRGSVPDGSTAVVLNLTVTEPAQAGFATVYPCDSIPSTSNVNFVAGQTVANTVIAKMSPTGTVCVFVSTATHLVADVNGSSW